MKGTSISPNHSFLTFMALAILGILTVGNCQRMQPLTQLAS